MSNPKVEKFFNMLNSDQELGYDVETGGVEPGDGTPLDWKRGHICGYSLSDGVDSVYIPVGHDHGNIPNPDAFIRNVQDGVKRRRKKGIKLVGHNIKFDAHFSLNEDIDLGSEIVDTMVNEALLDENKKSYSLDNTCKSYDVPQKLGKELYVHIGQMFGLKADRSTLGHYYRLNGEDPLAVEYAERDTMSTIHLWWKQRDKIVEQGLQRVLDIERRLSHVLLKMERRGVKIDTDELEAVSKKIDEMHYEAYCQIPLGPDLTPINPKSQRDLEAYFRQAEIFDWPINDPTPRFPEGSPSFNKAYLKKHEEGLIILNARKYDTFKNMFLVPFPTYIFKGRIHCRFNQAVGEFGGARPGRLSCADPNMQFVPKRDEVLGKLFRKIFVADEGYTLVELDYSQAEPRLFTHYSGEPYLLEGYKKTPPVDMHSIAAEYMGITRAYAKNLNLGMMYVMGYASLANHLNIELEEAKNIARLWHRTFPKVSSFSRDASMVAANRGYVYTLLGRRARFNDPRWSYRAANRIVQGGSADILKYKMVQLDDTITELGLEDEIQMLLTIHDSIVFQIKDARLQEHIALVKGIMDDVQSEPFNLRVPFTTDVHSGKNWSVATYGH